MRCWISPNGSVISATGRRRCKRVDEALHWGKHDIWNLDILLSNVFPSTAGPDTFKLSKAEFWKSKALWSLTDKGDLNAVRSMGCQSNHWNMTLPCIASSSRSIDIVFSWFLWETRCRTRLEWWIPKLCARGAGFPVVKNMPSPMGLITVGNFRILRRRTPLPPGALLASSRSHLPFLFSTYFDIT